MTIRILLLLLCASAQGQQEPLEDVSVSFSLKRGALTATKAEPPAPSDGVQVELRGGEAGAYVVSVWRRDGGVQIEKVTPAGRAALTPVMAAPAASKIRASVRNEPDGSARVWLELDGKTAAAVVDRDPVRGAGRNEVLSRNAQFETNGVKVEAAPQADVVAPVINGPEAQNVTDMLATVYWSTDEPADGLVEYGETAAYGRTAKLAALATSHTAALGGLKANTQYHYRVKSKDAQGNVAASPDMLFTTTAGPDREGPDVTITSPPPAAGLTGEVQLSANAFDDNKVAGVTFRVDGVIIGSELPEPPYGLAWDTRKVANGVHVLTAAARDSAGKVTISGPVTVTIRN